MRIIEAQDYKDMSRKAANIISAQMILKPESVIGLATGSTPIGVYDQLTEWYKKGDLDFSKIHTVNLDEYKGIDAENKQSYHYFMNQHLFSRVNIELQNTFVPDGMNENQDEECQRYEKLIAGLGGVDLQLLGLGHNGHIGFNEPAEVFVKQTHCVSLSEKTIQANQRFFESKKQVPKQAYTMGIGTIMSARKILIIISGEDKAEAVKKSFGEEISPHVPASILQLHHDVTVIADHLKQKRTVIVNLEGLAQDVDTRKAIFYFMSGAVYVLDGSIQKVSKAIFILAPNNVDIDANIKKELESKAFFPWQK